ncbi:MAG: hypothetical protein IIC57_10200 [Proteobacteria bacterium]|nr:hypothetical protein [Pseudomonadota bacterium]
MDQRQGDGEVLVEFHRVGNSIKVSAIDAKTYVEVSIIAPVDSTQKHMTDTVLQKLHYVLAKRKRDE